MRLEKHEKAWLIETVLRFVYKTECWGYYGGEGNIYRLTFG